MAASIASAGVRRHILAIRSSMISHSARASPTGATTASVACRNGVGCRVWNASGKSSRSYMVAAGST